MQQSGAEAVKIEGGARLAPLMGALRERASRSGGTSAWSHSKYACLDATASLASIPPSGTVAGRRLALEKAGCFALLLEMTEPNLARTITET